MRAFDTFFFDIRGLGLKFAIFANTQNLGYGFNYPSLFCFFFFFSQATLKKKFVTWQVVNGHLGGLHKNECSPECTKYFFKQDTVKELYSH